MDAEFSVELGADDPTLAVPWFSSDAKIAYVNLRNTPEAIEQLAEVRSFPELGELLRALNAQSSSFQTAKCDAWFDSLMDVDDEPYEAAMKCACYIDLFFAAPQTLASFPEHEKQARSIVQRLRESADRSARAEVIIRRAYFREDEGFYWTIYVFGYGNELQSAWENWKAALVQLRTALLG